jgi:hypothetical protein
MRTAGPERAYDYVADVSRQNLLRADLDDARLAGSPFGEKGAEIKIMREDHQPIFAGIL